MKFNMDEFKNKFDSPLFSIINKMVQIVEECIGSNPIFSILCLSTNEKIIQVFKKMIEQSNGRMLILDESKKKLDNIRSSIGYLAQTIDPNLSMTYQLSLIGNDINIHTYDLIYIDIDEQGKEKDPHEISLDILQKFLLIYPKMNSKTLIVINSLSDSKPYLQYVDNVWSKLGFRRNRMGNGYNFYEKKM